MDSKESIKYITRNFSKSEMWFKRIFKATLFFAALVSILTYFFELSNIWWLLIIVLYTFSIAGFQVEELTISEKSIIVEQKSLIPFMSSIKEIRISEITSIRPISDQSSNERGWYATERLIKNILEVNSTGGTYVLIHSKLHPEGIKAIERIITESMKSNSR